MPKLRLEKELYPAVERWLCRSYRCFRSAVNKGLRYGRIDVIGVRDVGGDLSGDVEVIAIEVKRGSFPFANACGQTLGYSVYAHRVYLADVRGEPFSQDEIQIASQLQIGLIRIHRGICSEMLSSPVHQPMPRLQWRLLETMGLGRCQLCQSVFAIGNDSSRRFSRLSRENLARAMESNKGLMFWNREVAKRKNRLRLRVTKDGTTFERRFICPDCVEYVLSQMVRG